MLAILLALALSQNTPQVKSAAPAKQQTAQTDQRGADSLPIAVKLLNTGKSTQEAAQDSQTVADNRKANARQFWLNIGLLMLTVVQAVGLVWSIVASSITTRRQLRAYVAVSTSGIIPDDYGGTGRLFIRFKNSGQTPAYDLIPIVGNLVVPVEVAKAYPFPEHPEPERAATSTTLGPGCDYTIRRRYEKEEMVAVEAGTHRFYIFGRIEYRDAFGKKRYTAFRHFWSQGRGRDETMPRAKAGNDAT